MDETDVRRQTDDRPYRRTHDDIFFSRSLKMEREGDFRLKCNSSVVSTPVLQLPAKHWLTDITRAEHRLSVFSDVHVRYKMSSSVRLSVCLSVCMSSVVCRLSSVTFVHPTQAIEIFRNVSTPFGTLAICDPLVKILRSSSQGTLPSGVKLKRSRKM